MAAGAVGHPGRENGLWLVYSIDEVAGLTAVSRNLHYDEMRLGNLAYVNVGRRRLITRQYLQHFLESAS
jgi:excisionase family DNA binding protein